MTPSQIQDRLQSQEYNFLRENEHLKRNVILLTNGGSHAYGTNVETSDLDIRGITVERPNEILGLGNFEHFINTETDTTIYGLKKIFHLLLNCNPNTIEILGTKDEHVFKIDNYGEMIRNNSDIFLSKKAFHAFGGYATAQLRRLQNALARDSYPQSEKENHIKATIETQLNNIEGRYQELTEGSLNLYIDKSCKEGYDTEIFMDCNMNKYPLRDFKNIYSEMSNVIRDYEKLNHRNSKKDELHLNKHMMHLIRLYLMGTEILEGKGINTYRENDRDLLLDIRNGKYSHFEIFKMVDELEVKFKYAYENSPLPAKPDYKRAEEMLIEIYRGVLI